MVEVIPRERGGKRAPLLPGFPKREKARRKIKRLQKYNNLEWDCVRFATLLKLEGVFAVLDRWGGACG
jgi:hypothetical protein